MDRIRLDPGFHQLFHQLVCAMLGPAKDQYLVPFLRSDQMNQELRLGFFIDGMYDLLDILRGGVARRDIDFNRIREHGFRQLPDWI